MPSKESLTQAELGRIAEKAREVEGKNPPTVIDALLSQKHKIGGLDTLPLTLAHYIVLEKIKSPFLTASLRDYAKLSSGAYMDMAFVITHSANESRDLLAEGEDVFKDAVFKFCERIDIKDMTEVGIAIGATLLQAQSTTLKTQKKTAATRYAEQA